MKPTKERRSDATRIRQMRRLLTVARDGALISIEFAGSERAADYARDVVRLIDAELAARAESRIATTERDLARERAAWGEEEVERERVRVMDYHQRAQDWEEEAKRAEVREAATLRALAEVSPHGCGGYGDFPPEDGWDAWEDRHAEVLARANALVDALLAGASSSAPEEVRAEPRGPAADAARSAPAGHREKSAG